MVYGLAPSGSAPLTNVANGFSALSNGAISGTNNTAEGYFALANVSTGNANTGFGFNAGSTVNTGSNNCFLGSQSQPSSAAGVHQVVLGEATTGIADNSVTIDPVCTQLHMAGLGTQADGAGILVSYESGSMKQSAGTHNTVAKIDTAFAGLAGGTAVGATFTPTFTGLQNITTPTEVTAYYQQIGTIVTVYWAFVTTISGSVTNTLGALNMAVPVALTSSFPSNIVMPYGLNASPATGTDVYSPSGSTVGSVVGTSTVMISYDFSTTGSAHSWGCTGHYTYSTAL